MGFFGARQQTFLTRAGALHSIPRQAPGVETKRGPDDRLLATVQRSDQGLVKFLSYFIAIPRRGNMLEFKITRGSWESVEVDQHGNDIDNHIYRWGDVEWLELEVVKWKDLP